MKPRTLVFVLAATLAYGAAALAQAPTAPKPDARVEQHIKRLHDELKITPAEETQWDVVAQTMRDNAAQIDKLIVQREQAPKMNALQDLDSYAQITQANSDGVKKLAAVFAPLYNAMPDAQKQNADKVFAETHERHVTHKRKQAPSHG